jgi:outer membrane protein assembly factor BamB
VVAVISKGDFYCFDRNGGALRLKRRLPFAAATAPALSRATAYVPSWDNDRVHAIDLTTGALGWFFRARGPVTASPIVAGEPPREVLYVASENGAVTAVEAAPAGGAPGLESWPSTTNGANRAALATTADGAILLVASEDTFLYGFDRISGEKRWAFGAQTPLRNRPYAVPGAVYVDTGREFVSLDAASGSVRWRAPGSYRFLVRSGGQTFALSGSSQVVVFDDATGSPLGRYDMSAYAFFATNTEGDVLYAATRDGQIFALGKKLL